MKEIGKFKLESGIIRASDPCYDKNVWCSGTFEAENGEWDVYIEKKDIDGWGKRIAELSIFHKNHNQFRYNGAWELSKITGGVDSGQFGFFDDKYYGDDDTVKDNELCNIIDIKKSGDKWYSVCCNNTIGDKFVGVIPFGCVSRTGLGDGNYPIYTITIENKVVAAKVIFIGDEEE